MIINDIMENCPQVPKELDSTCNISLDPPAGTRDFAPEEMRVRNWLFGIWRSVSKSAGFQEYDCPIVEYQNLYTRKGGDDILKEMFAFTLGNNKLCLRPELTPSVARMIMKHYKTQPAPFKWFSLPQCFRYEDIKRGRKREHYQWNADIFGAEKITSEIEVFMMITTFFEKIDLTPNDIVIKVSNRMILQKVLNKMGVSDEHFTRACVLIDKIAKITKEEMSQSLTDDIGLTAEQIGTIYDLCNVTNIDDIAKFLDQTDETYLEMKEIFNLAEKIGIKPWLQFDASIVRGLSYYTGIVFEAFPKNLPGLQKSICGGGRYDNLLTSYGYRETVPAVGFGFGDVVITELLKDLGKLPKLKNETEFLVVPFDSTLFAEAAGVAQRMRQTGKLVELYTSKTRVGHALDYADRKGINSVVLIAPTEWQKGNIVLKLLREPKNSPLKQQELPLQDFLKM